MDDIWFEDKSGMSVDIVKGMTVVRANLTGNCKEVSEQLFENAHSSLRKLCLDIWKICSLLTENAVRTNRRGGGGEIVVVRKKDPP